MDYGFRHCVSDECGLFEVDGGREMKKIVIVIGIVILLLFMIRSKALQSGADRFMKSNESHEQKQIQDFLSQ